MSITPETILVFPDVEENYIIQERELLENPNPQFNNNILVTRDNLSNRLYFNMYYTFDDNELAQKEICILWQNANKDKGISICKDITVVNDRLSFSWNVPIEATYVEGTIDFSIRITDADYIWNSLIGHVEVRKGIDYYTTPPTLAPTGWTSYIEEKCDVLTTKLTKNQYEALATKDNDTLYAVTDATDGSVYLYLGDTLITIPAGDFELLKGIVDGKIINMELPEGITIISDYFFSGGVNYLAFPLKTVTIPSTVTTIGKQAFYACESLESITIAETGLQTIDYEAFRRCTSLRSIRIPATVRTINYGAFQTCSSLTSAYFEDGVYFNTLNSNAANLFTECSSLVNVRLPNGLFRIPIYCFSSCTSLTTIEIPNSIAWIGSQAFEDCTSLTNITWSTSLTKIETGAFRRCSSLTSINIPTVTTIEADAFNSCTSLETVRLDAITTINDTVFQYCSALKSVYIGSAITTIYAYAFRYCTALTDIYIDLPSTQTQISVSSSHWGATNSTIHWNDE